MNTNNTPLRNLLAAESRIANSDSIAARIGDLEGAIITELRSIINHCEGILSDMESDDSVWQAITYIADYAGTSTTPASRWARLASLAGELRGLGMHGTHPTN